MLDVTERNPRLPAWPSRVGWVDNAQRGVAVCIFLCFQHSLLIGCSVVRSPRMHGRFLRQYSLRVISTARVSGAAGGGARLRETISRHTPDRDKYEATLPLSSQSWRPCATIRIVRHAARASRAWAAGSQVAPIVSGRGRTASCVSRMTLWAYLAPMHLSSKANLFAACRPGSCRCGTTP